MPEGINLFQDTLIKSLKFGFVDNIKYQEGGYSPQILVNNSDEKRYVLTDLQEELSKCTAFYFSVAFVTKNGIAMIKSQLSDLMDKKVPGKILISPYLDFNDPDAMRELLKLKNVEVRLTPEKMQMHAKFYLFEHTGKQVLISGSSNLTHTALKINYEWNIKLTSTHNGEFIQNTKSEFDRIWEQSELLTSEIIDTYAKKRKKVISLTKINDEEKLPYSAEKIVPNKMQEAALEGLKNIREQGKDRALVISATGTGKTFLSAFDVKQYNPERMLFIVHREQILKKSLIDFQKVLGFNPSEGHIYHSGDDLTGKKYIFATIQTLSREDNLKAFSKDFFDTSDERVKHILNKIDFYGVCNNQVRGLIFCSSKAEARELSIKLNQHGKRTIALTGDDDINYREKVVKQLEDGELEYILTVDIFNEGIDIPSVNQVVMLRNTQSSIIFVQQLGRGLRKHKSKDYVTIIDFIGNYKNNYLIPIALFGDKSMNKDNYRRELREPNILSGLTTVNFEEVAKEQIFKSITNTVLSNMKILKDAYTDLENKLGRTPMLIDHLTFDNIDPIVFFNNNSFKNYADVINKFLNKSIELTDTESNWLSFITFELLPGKRKHELLLLQKLIKKGEVSKDKFIEILETEQLSTRDSIISSVENVLSLQFLKSQEVKKFGTEPLVTLEKNVYKLNPEVLDCFKNSDFALLFNDVIEAGLYKANDYPEIFTIGQKYSRRDVCKLLNWSKDEPPLNIGGYKIDKNTNTCPIFITYHKDDEISDTIKYEDELLNETTLKWFSKNKRTLESPDVKAIINSPENGLDLKLFIIKDDAEGGDFYYLGDLTIVPSTVEELVRPLESGNESIVTMNFKLDNPVPDTLYRYITNK
ncbi:MAG: DUF3427 domain-containing protein [Streptococcus salivarius]|nr:DUF3427 domain-containing protein [Streptococcus salivarius]